MMTTPFEDKTILLGITGSIAAYKAADLASKLAQTGARVDAILTQSALNFITPLTLQSVTGRQAYIDADLWGGQGHVLHIGLGKHADLYVIAPASAQTLAKLASGLADNLLTLAALASNCPMILAPAMDGGMFIHPATQANLNTLRERGAIIVGPAEGHLASGLSGVGRMAEPAEIFGHVRLLLARSGPLQGKKVVVTAGGTQEPLDPVRVIMNRSSGKQGFALAQAALDRGARVVLITGPTPLATPIGVERIETRTAREMNDAVLAAVKDADVLLMAAAVADFQPASPAKNKIKREGGVPEIRLEKAPDILAAVAELKADQNFPRVTVGFAAESQDLVANARKKLRAKKLDMIVANDITSLDSGFAVDTNRVTLLTAEGGEENLPLLNKNDVADAVLDRVVNLLSEEG